MAREKLTLPERLGFHGRKIKRENQKKASPLPEFISQTPGNDYIEKIFRLPLGEGRCKLNLKSIYGNIVISGYDCNMVYAKVMYKPKKSDGDIKFTVNDDNEYFLDCDEKSFASVWIEVHMPARFFREIQLRADHGKILLSNVSTGHLSVRGSAVSKLKNIFAADLFLETAQKSAHLLNVAAMKGQINLTGGSLNATCLDIKDLVISAGNSPIVIRAGCDRYNDYKWNIKSREEKINVNLPHKHELGYYILAEARAGGVKMALRNMDILIGGHNFIEAKSKDYKDLPKRFNLELTAVKAPVVIS